MSGDEPNGDMEVEIISYDIEEERSGDQGKEGSAASGDETLDELERVKEEVEHFRELYMRKLADFDNFRKRNERERAEARKLAHVELLRDFLPVVDNLERALAVPAGDGDGLRLGLDLVLRQFREVLGHYGVVEVSPEGEPFDPAVHEAVSRRETTEVEPNSVVHVLQKGYMLEDRLLRPALVDVAVAPVNSGEGGDGKGGGA